MPWGPEESEEEESSSPSTSSLGPMEAAYIANADGWSNADTAAATGVSEQEAAEAAAAAAEDDESTN